MNVITKSRRTVLDSVSQLLYLNVINALVYRSISICLFPDANDELFVQKKLRFKISVSR